MHHCSQLSHTTTQHRTVLIIFTLNVQTTQLWCILLDGRNTSNLVQNFSLVYVTGKSKWLGQAKVRGKLSYNAFAPALHEHIMLSSRGLQITDSRNTFQFHANFKTLLKATVRTSFPLSFINDARLVLQTNILLTILHGPLEKTCMAQNKFTELQSANNLLVTLNNIIIITGTICITNTIAYQKLWILNVNISHFFVLSCSDETGCKLQWSKRYRNPYITTCNYFILYFYMKLCKGNVPYMAVMAMFWKLLIFMVS